MSSPSRTQWVADRKQGIGGSDCASLMNIGYGCRLRLWRDKRNEIPDYPLEENAAMELGRVLEPFFAEQYLLKTGRNVIVRPEPAVHPRYPYLRANVDRMLEDTGDSQREVGALEIKAVGRDVFYKLKREGLPEDYILQLQHVLLVTGSEWGAFAIGSRDTGQLLYWDVVQDPAIAELIIAEGEAFWREVETGQMPARLEPDDRRCQRCEYRLSCQGAALIQIETAGKEELEQDETLRPLVNEYLERRNLQSEAEELADETREELKTALGDRQAVSVAGHKLYFRPQSTMRGDFAALATAYDSLLKLAASMVEAHPELGSQDHKLQDEYRRSEAFKVPSQSRPLRIY